MSRIVNIMPMAGLGKRFLNSDFNLPKPLIKVFNKPMFIQAAKSMPKSDLNIFICNKNLLKKYKIKKILFKEYNNKFKIITVNKTTKGQANTCLLAERLIKDDDKIFIHSCDSLIKYSLSDLNKKLKNSDGVILTTQPNNLHLKSIKSFGWINCKKNKINKITCKKKASSKPNKDSVIIGTFAFRNKKIYSKTIRDLFKTKKKVNNEYYMDMVFSNALEKNYKISNLNVKSYISWGTPKELIEWKKRNAKI
jgi:NDP-sugar pyrophosphorylase family protein